MMSNMPNLRFPEFEGDWVEKRLGEIISIENKKEDPSKSTNLDKCLELEHLSSKDGIILGFIDPKKQKSIKNKFYKGQVLYGKLRPYLRKYWLATFDGLCSSEIWVLQGKKVINNFLYYLIQGDQYNQVANISCGSKMPRADWSLMKNANIFVPLENEQTKIADFFTLIDKKISKQGEKIAALEQYKKGLMQKIFSREIRFKDDNGKVYPEWEKKCIAEYALSLDYGMNTAAKPYDGTNQYLRITDIDEATRTYNSEKRVSPSGKLDDYYLLDEGDILFTRTGASTGKSFYYNSKYGKMYFAGYLIRLRLSNCVSSKYLYYNTLTEDFRSWVKIMSMRSGQPGINAKEFGSYQVYVPIKAEQTKIANFLSLYDRKIEKEKAKLEAFRLQKKGLLQQMFV